MLSQTMTQAQIDLQIQLEQATPTDLITRPLSNDSPVLYIDTSEKTPPTFLEPMEHTKVENENPKPTPPQDDTDHTQSTPPPPKKRYEIMKDPIFLSSPIYPPSIPSKISLCTNRDDHLISILSTDDFVFKAQLTSLYMHPTDYSFRLYDKKTSSHPLLPKSWVHTNIGSRMELKFSLSNSIFLDLLYTISKRMNLIHPFFLSHKKLLIIRHTKFLQYTKPQNYIFVNYKYTSPFTMTNMYTLDHSCITGYLRNYDPIKQYFCLLPYNNTSRPLIVPQEYLIHYDDFLLPCNIPTQIAKPLTVIKHLVSSPLDDKDRTYYTALYKQTYSYNELLFISAKTISFMVQAEQKTDHKSHTSPIKNTHDKLSSVINNRTLRDMTNLLEPYKRNSSETPITTLTHVLHCYDRTHKLLQTLDLDSQRITQSSQAIQSALETITTLFNSTNLH